MRYEIKVEGLGLYVSEYRRNSEIKFMDMVEAALDKGQMTEIKFVIEGETKAKFEVIE